MNLHNQHFLNILRHAMLREPPAGTEALTEPDWEALMHLASEHKLLPLFADTLRDIPGAKSVLDRYRPAVRRQVMVQTIKTDELLRLYRFLLQAGIRPLVVKGILCRSLYPNPDLRPSADEDLVVQPEQFAAACQALAEFGMVCVSPDSGGQELAFRKPDSPLYIELHGALFPEGGSAYGHWNDLFGDVFLRAEPVEVQGVPILAPEPTDHLLYLIGHALKHFLHSGFGIRQVCDLGVFAERFGSRIDWYRVAESCDRLQARDFTAAVFRIAEQHLGFDRKKAGIPDGLFRRIDEMPMLEDLLSGGVYGTASKTRAHSSTVTLSAASADRDGKRARASVIPSLFPSAESLAGRYPFLKDKPWLLPAAWGMRIAAYGKELRKSPDSSAVESARLGVQRVDLLRFYGVIGGKKNG